MQEEASGAMEPLVLRTPNLEPLEQPVPASAAAPPLAAQQGAVAETPRDASNPRQQRPAQQQGISFAIGGGRSERVEGAGGWGDLRHRQKRHATAARPPAASPSKYSHDPAVGSSRQAAGVRQCLAESTSAAHPAVEHSNQASDSTREQTPAIPAASLSMQEDNRQVEAPVGGSQAGVGQQKSNAFISQLATQRLKDLLASSRIPASRDSNEIDGSPQCREQPCGSQCLAPDGKSKRSSSAYL